MVVVVIVGVLSASATPSIVDMVKKAEGEQALVESASALAEARDRARSEGTCIDYIQSPPQANAGPYTLQVVEVDCPGADRTPGNPHVVFERAVSKSITSLRMTALIESGVSTGRIHFDSNGAVYQPMAQVRVDAVVNGTNRGYSIYPAAGTISFAAIK